MEKSLNSSPSEPTVPALKSVFKPSSTSVHAFDVSLNESSPSISKSNKSTDLDKEATLTVNKIIPFKRQTSSVSQNFSVNFEETNTESDFEQSVVLPKQKSLFKAKNKSVGDKFCVSFNETNVNITNKDSLSKSISGMDEEDVDVAADVNKSNIFKKKNKSNIDMFNVEYDETNDDDTGVTLPLLKSLFKKPKRNSNNFHVTFNETNSQPVNEISGNVDDRLFQESGDVTDLVNKDIPFRKPPERHVKDVFQVDFCESTFSDDSKTVEPGKLIFKKPNNSTQNFQVSFEETGSQKEMSQKKLNYSSKDTTIGSVSSEKEVIFRQESFTHESVCDQLVTSNKMAKLSKDSTRLTDKSDNSGMYLNQSSFNDENLNNWMSDHSDEEMQLPTVPCVTTNISFTKETSEMPKKPILLTEGNTSLSWEQKFNEIVSHVKVKTKAQDEKNIASFEKAFKNLEIKNKRSVLPKENYQPPKLRKPAKFATKKLYQYLINKLEPKFGIDTLIQAEEIVLSICDTVKKVTRRKTHQKKLIQDLKKEMAELGLITTTIDFYEFIIKYLPYDFRVKVVPCIQPVTNTVFPPKDTGDPFDKIL